MPNELIDVDPLEAEAQTTLATYEEEPNIIPRGAISLEKELPPAKVMAQAQEKAKVLIDAVKQAGLAYDLGGKKPHLGVEAWLILGKFDNATPRLVNTRRLTEEDGTFKGYEAFVEVLKHGQVISGADSMCTRDEPNWNNRRGVAVPEFQLRSMAITRATSKALRLTYGWIAVLAGYSATPAEEMTGDEYAPKSAPTGDPTRPVTPAEAAIIMGGTVPTNAHPCAICGKPMKQIPPGVSKSSGIPYDAFWACEDRAHRQPRKKK